MGSATYTVATMDVPRGLWKWFREKFEKAGYQHVIDDRKGHELLDMTHIGLVPEDSIGTTFRDGKTLPVGKKKCLIEVYQSAAGVSLVIGDKQGGYRLQGPKVGGGRRTHMFEVDIDELIGEALILREKP